MTTSDTSGEHQANGSPTDWAHIAGVLSSALKLTVPPIAITFSYPGQSAPAVAAYGAPFAAPAESGRTGRVAAGCVFWTEATQAEFQTVAEDHANCSVGSVTHGFKQASEVTANDDVATLLSAGWVGQRDLEALPVVKRRPDAVVYGSLAKTTVEPDVVLVRVNGRGLMTIKDSVDDLTLEGKPQCHIVAIAKEQNRVAASVGCALSRARTGMSADEMTCAFPAQALVGLAEDLERNDKLNSEVASYAGADARRFRAGDRPSD